MPRRFRLVLPLGNHDSLDSVSGDDVQLHREQPASVWVDDLDAFPDARAQGAGQVSRVGAAHGRTLTIPFDKEVRHSGEEPYIISAVS